MLGMYTHVTGECGATARSAIEAFVHLLTCPKANAPSGEVRSAYSDPVKRAARRERVRRAKDLTS